MSRIASTLAATMILAALARPVATTAQIRVNPTGVNVNTQGATTVFLTFGGLAGYRPAEAAWCGELLPATPARGAMCDPATLFGIAPARYVPPRASGTDGLTDIMSIPPSVTRRAYQAAQAGASSSFFYVRRFVSTSGAPDEYVAVTCRLAGGGARVPLALTDVTLGFDVETPVLHLQPGEAAHPLSAEIRYNGTGRLQGRWEVVRPGEALPEPRDLLTEATLPLEERGTQRRYAEVQRFNIFLPPSGRMVLPGPDPARLPTDVDGTYLVLLRVEASDDKEGDSNLSAVGAGTGIAHTGAVAGFPLPTLRYFVGGGGSSDMAGSRSPGALRTIYPAEGARIAPGAVMDFTWTEVPRAAYYRLEITDADGAPVLDALVRRGLAIYRSPPWLAEKAGGKALRWRVVALDLAGWQVKRSPWRRLEPGSTP